MLQIIIGFVNFAPINFLIITQGYFLIISRSKIMGFKVEQKASGELQTNCRTPVKRLSDEDLHDARINQLAILSIESQNIQKLEEDIARLKNASANTGLAKHLMENASGETYRRTQLIEQEEADLAKAKEEFYRDSSRSAREFNY